MPLRRRGPLNTAGRARGGLLCLSVMATLALAACARGEGATPTRVSIRALQHPNGGTVIITGRERPVEISAFRLSDPPRLVFDLFGAVLSPDQPRVVDLDDAGRLRLRVGQFQADPPVARLVLDVSAVSRLRWDVKPGNSPGERAIEVEAEAAALQLPEIEANSQGVTLRVRGVGRLARRVGTLRDPPRIYVDFVGAEPQSSLSQTFAEGPITEIRLGRQQQGDDGAPRGRLVVELRREAPHKVVSDGDDLAIVIGSGAAAPETRCQGLGDALRGKLIVVDPGHGGKDVGAMAQRWDGSGVVYEKDITLDIALRLARLLEKAGARVVMTRSDDSYVSLRERADLANRLGADAFVSIHCDSCERPHTMQGTSVYYDHGHSLALALLVQEELVAALGTRDRGVRNANFSVIRRARMPGVLVETAYINHREDQSRLLDPGFRDRAAAAVARGLARFLAGEGEP